MASQQIYQLYESNPLTPALTDVVPFQPNDAGATEMGASTWADIKNLFIPYKTYSIKLDQFSNGAINVVNLINDTGNTITTTANGDGSVFIQYPSFDQNKITITTGVCSTVAPAIYQGSASNTGVVLNSLNPSTLTAENELFSNTFIEIRFYN